MRRAARAVATVTVVALVAACAGQARSAEAFCDTMESEQERILEQFEANKGDGSESFESVLSGLGASIQALGELRTYFNKLAKVAPPEIETEAEIVAEQYDEMLGNAKDSIDNPVGALFGGLMTSIEMSGPLNTMDEYAVEHCGTHI